MVFYISKIVYILKYFLMFKIRDGIKKFDFFASNKQIIIIRNFI